MTQRYSYSALQDFKACPLRYRLSRLDNLELRREVTGTESHHLVFGSAAHEGLQHLYENNYSNQAPDAYQRLVIEAQEVARVGYPVHLDPTDKAKTPETIALIMAWYARRWGVEDRRWRVLDCEGLDTGNFESGLEAVRVDLIVEDLEHGGIYGVDHKFTSSRNGQYLNAQWWGQFEPNSQITGYVDYITEKYGRCDGFYINGIGLNWRDAVKTNGASNVELFEVDDPGKGWLAYSHREKRFVKGNKHREMYAAWGLQARFERMMFNRTVSQIEQERASTRIWIYAIEGMASTWPFNTASCTYCEYKPLCSAGWQWPQDEEVILGTYRVVCREVMQIICPACTGTGADRNFIESLFKQLTSRDWWMERQKKFGHSYFDFSMKPCDACEGRGSIAGPRCALDKDHEGGHADTLPLTVETEITIEVSE
jgi:hypothetical protein